MNTSLEGRPAWRYASPPQDRWLLWGWVQERRKAGSYAYAGCLTVPRVLVPGPGGRVCQVCPDMGAAPPCLE